MNVSITFLCFYVIVVCTKNYQFIRTHERAFFIASKPAGAPPLDLISWSFFKSVTCQ